MSEERWPLPSLWEWASIGDIAEIVGGGTPDTKDEANFVRGEGIPWLTPADLTGYKDPYVSRGARDLSERGYKGSSAKLMPPGTVLFSSRAPIGYCVIASNEICTNQGFKSFVLKDGLSPEFLRLYLIASVDYARSKASGTTFQELSGGRAAELAVPIAPLAEQRRIVAKIDSLSAKSKRSCDHLDHIPRLAEKYKQALLGAGFAGGLTTEWRLSSKRITDVASRIDWTTSPLAGFARYVSELPALPDGWSWMPLGAIADVIDPNPSHRYPKYEGGTVPLLSTREFVGEDGWSLQGAPLVSTQTFSEQNTRCRFNSGDIIFARKGRLGLARRPPPCEKYTFSHTIFIIKPGDKIDQQYAIFYLRWSASIDWLLREMNSNTGVPTLGKGTLQLLPIAVPPISEQREIARKIAYAFSIIDRQVTDAAAARKLARHLDNAILAKAFRGELVPQDPNDEPASALLERIRVERQTSSTQPVGIKVKRDHRKRKHAR